MVKLKRLKLLKYRNVRPDTELRFDDGFNLLLGKNGTGKTTLLGLIAAVAGHDFERLANEEFSLEYEIAYEFTTVIVSLDNTMVVNPTGIVEHLYRFQTTHVDRRSGGRAIVTGTPEKIEVNQDGTLIQGRPLSPFVRHSGWLLLDHPETDSTNYGRLLQSPFRFDESLDTFLAMTGRTSTTPGVESPRMSEVKVGMVDPTLTGSGVTGQAREYSFFPFAWVFEVGRSLRDDKLPIELLTATHNPSDPTYDLLTTATELLGYSKVSIHPIVRSESTNPKQKLRTFHIQGFTFHFTRPDTSSIHHDLLSFGQKRLFSFFYYLAYNNDYIVADELVNGLHHRWIEACMQAIGDRQAFLTSQNPLLFDYVPDFESAQQVQSSFITCKAELVDGAEQLVWENMTADDAERFFQAYQAEIQSVGEILITKGLW